MIEDNNADIAAAGDQPGRPEETQQPENQAPAEAPKTPKPVQLQNQARIEWLNDDGTVANRELCLRGLGPLLDRLLRDKPTDEDKQRRVRITLLGDAASGLVDGKPAEIVGIEDTLENVTSNLSDGLVPPPLVIANYQRMSEQMAERGNLKAAMVTAVFEGARAAGFGYMTAVAEVSDADLVTLVEAVENQAKMFKDRMRALRPQLKFASDEDKSRIIIPGR